MFENLKKLYKHYGGIKAVINSWYFWVAAFLTALSYDSIFDFSWADITLSVLPSLTGFTIAAFAIIFAILDAELLKKLMVPDGKGHSPISSIASSIGHAVFIQVSALILAIASKTIDLGIITNLVEKILLCQDQSTVIFLISVKWATNFFSGIGLLFTFYGVVLVLAAILSIVRMQLIVAGATAKSRGADSK
ncbi:MAG: hypothetical protein HRU33_09130 [Rhodobacteraceae bacterium]|nr:hypothetical protein [Paracoccaceae bacterium]